MSVTGLRSGRDKLELQEKIASGSQKLEDYVGLADLLVGEDKHEEAIKLLESALNLSISDIKKAQAAVELGWLIYNVEEPSRALSSADRSLDLLSNELESFERTFLEALTLSLTAHCLWLDDNQAATEAGSTALRLFERIIRDAPEFDRIVVVQYEAARICNLLGLTQKSLQLCATCLGQSLTDEYRLSCLVTYGEALRLERHFGEAERVLKEALSNVKLDAHMLPRIHFDLASTYRDAGQLIKARDSFVLAFDALRSFPGLQNDRQFLSDLYWNIASLCYELKDYEKATRIFEEVLARQARDDVHYWNAVTWLGYCHEAKGNYDQARAYFESVLASSYAAESDKIAARQGLERSNK